MSESPRQEADESTSHSGKEFSECPTCGRDDFKSRHGMKVHHKQSHGESILDRVVVECENCGDDIHKTPSQAERDIQHFCDKDCLGEYRSGEDHHFWKGGKTQVECEVCRKKIERADWQLERGANVCSNECRIEMTTVDYPGYIKKGERYYTSDWPQIREKVIQRDGGVCRICGISRKQSQHKYNKDLNVHHIIPARKFDTIEDANELDNLVAVCMSCHSTWEGIPVFPNQKD